MIHCCSVCFNSFFVLIFFFFFFKQKTAYEIGLGIPAEPLFRSTLFRYTQDAFSRSGWLWPVDAKGEPLKATSYMAVGFYVAKYVNKKSDMDLAAKGLGAKEWNNSRSEERRVGKECRYEWRPDKQ